MTFIQAITVFFESIFKKSSPEVQKRAFMRKIDAQIREFKPMICKNGMLQSNFAEALFALYKNTKPLDNLFSVTIHSNDLHRQQRFEAQLMITGYSSESQEIIEELEKIRRNLYTGSIGYFDLRGNCDFNIVIRTIIKKDNKAFFNVGGGITYESDVYIITVD